MDRILVVEDSQDAWELLRCALDQDYEVSLATSLVEARRRLEHEIPDLIVLDLRLPDGSGHDLCAELQARSATRQIPIVFLTSCVETREKVMAFSLGADDYVEKPFDPDELLARIRGRLRQRHGGDRQLIVAGPLRIDLAAFRVTLTTGDGARTIDLTPHELRLVVALARQRGSVVTRSELQQAVWGGIAISERTLNTHVSNLRRKLGNESPRIESVRGVGYRLR